MKSIIYKYDVMVPLVYNRFENTVSEHDTEQRLGLKETVSTSFDVIFRSYDIPDVPDGYDFKDKVIQLWELKCQRASSFICLQ